MSAEIVDDLTLEFAKENLKKHSEKSVTTEVAIAEEITNQTTRRTIYLPSSLIEKSGDDDLSLPMWIIKKSAIQAVFNWVSHYGKKGIDHLSGSYYEVTFVDSNDKITVGVTVSDIQFYARSHNVN